MEEFSCLITFQQEGRDTEHTIYVNPGYRLVERMEPVNVPRQISVETGDPQVTSTTRRYLESAAGCSTSSAPDESDTGNLEEPSKPPKDSKLLSSLQDSESYLKKVCNRLDREKPGVGDYHSVCSHYDIDDDTVVAAFDKYPAGPSRALLESLTALDPQLTVAEFARALRKIAKRADVAELLEEYDNP